MQQFSGLWHINVGCCVVQTPPITTQYAVGSITPVLVIPSEQGQAWPAFGHAARATPTGCPGLSLLPFISRVCRPGNSPRATRTKQAPVEGGRCG
jgi:hypothetical protein